MSPTERSSLHMDAEQMRRLGYRTVDMLVDRITGPPGPVLRSADPERILTSLSEPAPDGPAGFDEILDQLERDVLPYVARISHPGYLAFIPGEGTWPGALGDLIASALNLDTCWWLGASGPAALELVVLDWMRSWVGYPEQASGVLVSGGSAANLTALACARESLLGSMTDLAVAYVSDHAHVSLAKGARALGFRPDRVRVLATDAQGRMRPQALKAAIAADRAAGLRPLVCVASAGTTAMGAVDPFAELSAICREQGVWLHVDGAYGAFACLTERGRAALAGLELADSITLDPHKWLYQPVELGALLVREGSQLRRAFEVSHSYLAEVETGVREVNFSDLGLQLTRTCRALKLWMSIRYFGLDAFREAIDRCIDLAEHAQRRIEASPRLELVTPASLGIVTFRVRLDGVEDAALLDAAATDVAARVAESGEVFLSTAEVVGRRAIRLCILNHSTTREVVDRAIDLAESIEVDVASLRGERPSEREQAVTAGWLSRPELDADALRLLPLFASLDQSSAEHVVARMRQQTASPGEVVVGQFQPGRDLFVVLEGAVRVEADGAELARLGPGEFFGEMAVIDWGAGFGRSRSATVTAGERTRLAVLDWDLAAWLCERSPAFAELLDRAARERAASDAGRAQP